MSTSNTRTIERDGPQRYRVGETYRIGRVSGGGGPDGHYWTVVDEWLGHHTQFSDDTREGEPCAAATVRPATDEEAAAMAERIAAKADDDKRKLALREALRSSILRPSDSKPATGAVIVARDRLASEWWEQDSEGAIWCNLPCGMGVRPTNATPDLIAEAIDARILQAP